MTEPARKLNLALQGGGAHGAFTWGVPDRLLEDRSIEFSAISGTSAARHESLRDPQDGRRADPGNRRNTKRSCFVEPRLSADRRFFPLPGFA